MNSVLEGFRQRRFEVTVQYQVDVGGHLGGTGWEDGPPKILGGEDGPCIRPQYFEKYSVVGCVRKYELSKKRCHQGIFTEIEVFLVKKGPYMSYIKFHTVGA